MIVNVYDRVESNAMIFVSSIHLLLTVAVWWVSRRAMIAIVGRPLFSDVFTG